MAVAEDRRDRTYTYSGRPSRPLRGDAVGCYGWTWWSIGWEGHPVKQAGAHTYSVDSRDWQALLGGIGGRESDVMVEAKGK